ncbi:helix-turn-helix domain-containing protein [Devosia sp. UYZn731]|uniref:ArsR/SmtB family transcription factor n=1 Tax=Devosia sp. UYZn731 TaxID=3156345 RepID=UPI00339577E3
MSTIYHPDADQISLPNVLTALGDETRLAIIGCLARDEAHALTCGQFSDLGSKTALSYHISKLREAGVVNVRPDGTKRMVTLRRADLDSRFPGFLDSIIATTRYLPLPDMGEQIAIGDPVVSTRASAELS